MSNHAVKDTWPKARTRQQHFTADEVAYVECSYLAGLPVATVAQYLGCASRTIYMRYKVLRGEANERKPRRSTARVIRQEPKVPAPKPDRYYRSSFTPS